MSLALPQGGTGADLMLVRTLRETFPADSQQAVRDAFQRVENMVSPDVMPLLEASVADGLVSAAYPWRDGMPLAGALARAREAGVQPSTGVAGRLISEALGGLAALHSQRDSAGAPAPFSHGAFRADSLWLGFDGRTQLVDAGFSLACSLLEQPAWAVRTPRADVAQAGVLMHVILTGAMPPAALVAGGHDPRLFAGTLPEALAHLVMAATDATVENRPADAAELKEQWDGAMAMIGGMALHASVNRWLCTLFPSNHPLVEALRRVLMPLGAGQLLPVNVGPILSSPRLAPVRDKVPAGSLSSPRLAPVPAPQAAVPTVSRPRAAPVPAVSAPRQAPVVDAAAAPSVLDGVPAPPPAVSASRLAPIPVALPDAARGVLSPRQAPVVEAGPPRSISSPQMPIVDVPVAAPTVSSPRMEVVAAAVPVETPPPPADLGWSVPTFDGSAPPAAPSPPVSTEAPAAAATPTPAALDAAAAEAAFLADVPAAAAPPVQIGPLPQRAVEALASAAIIAPLTLAGREETTEPHREIPPPASQPAAVPAALLAPTASPDVAAPPPTPPPAPERRATPAGARPARTTTARRRAVPDPEYDVAPADLVRDPAPARRGPPPAAIAVVGALLGGVAVVATMRFLQTPVPVVKGADPLAAVEQPVTPRPVATPPPERPAPTPTAPSRAGTPTERPVKRASTTPARTVGRNVDEADMATLTLTVTPWANVWVDGRKVGRTPLKPLKLTPGKHVIRLENTDFHVQRNEKVDVQPGSWGELTVTFTP